jgi:hypothetical protein
MTTPQMQKLADRLDGRHDFWTDCAGGRSVELSRAERDLIVSALRAAPEAADAGEMKERCAQLVESINCKIALGGNHISVYDLQAKVKDALKPIAAAIRALPLS